MTGNKVEEMGCWAYKLAQAPKASAADIWPSFGKDKPIMERDTSTTLGVRAIRYWGMGELETHRRLCISQDALRLFTKVISVLNV